MESLGAFMSYGLKVKNARGEVVTDGISDIGQHIVQGRTSLNAWEGNSWDISGFTKSLNISAVAQITNNYASPYFRRYGDYLYTYNRFWYDQDPIPYFRISVLNVGRGEEDTGGTVYGFKSFGNNINSIINSNSRTMRWAGSAQFYNAGSTITGAYNDWVIGPTNYDISSLKFRTPPYVIVTPAPYSAIVDGSDYSYYALLWYATTTSFYIGSYLLQNATFEIVIPAITFRMLLLTLD